MIYSVYYILAIAITNKRNSITVNPIITLYEREPASIDSLPTTLATAYGGGLTFPLREADTRPYVFANFVESIDGIVSYNASGQVGGGVISGNNEQDTMVMGILRAEADAVIFGSSSLRQDAGHVRIPSFIYPRFTREYALLRQQLKRTEPLPISVIMTASGQLNLDEPTFHMPDLRVIIATTSHGYERLAQQRLPSSTIVHIIDVEDGNAEQHTVSPRGTLAMLAREYGVRSVLYEGGPTLLASFLAAHVVDELFLTFSPQLVGRDDTHERLALLEGYAFIPANAPWGTLLSVKQADSHLFLRYKL